MKFAYLIEPPFNFRDLTGNVVGHDVELAKHVFQELGETFEPVETEFAQLLPGLAADNWQMTTGLFATDERKKHAVFTRSIWALPDGLLVKKGNPLGLSGYQSISDNGKASLAVIRDQFQHRSAENSGVPEQRLQIFETYSEAAVAVCEGTVDAYASVGRAHTGFIAENSEWEIEAVEVPQTEKPAAFGSFSLALSETALRSRIDEILGRFLGSKAHRDMAKIYGFSDAEVNLVAFG